MARLKLTRDGRVILVAIFLAGHLSAEPVTRGFGDTPEVAEVLAVQGRIQEAVLKGDVAVLADLVSREVVVSDPGNKVRRYNDLIALFEKAEVDYRSVDTDIQFADQVGDLVVIMGTESTVLETAPDGTSWGPGTTLHRRFTNVFRNEDGQWRLIIKQSTVFSVE